MTTPQKIVQTILRWSTPLLVLAALGGTTMDGIFVAGPLLAGPRPTLLSNSPGGNYRALLYHRDTENSPTTNSSSNTTGTASFSGASSPSNLFPKPPST